ncbi:ABC-type transport auxiliary lipoprotein family protein [Propionivibrio sp.]|uniref:ABC-type transport auxiliary lipoprotein family protein n=1 Tax=Propionivibrio sp. TaxID=2212460 RepID=UPI00262DC937|nr:ABC-type transport auxiliary lipoprotein family protein [Propionivibrio sp.]
MNRLHAILLSLSLLLSACGNVPPAPIDRFYRLQPVSLSSSAKALPGAVAVQPFRADSLYAERPIVYSEATSLRQLRQYYYHLWLYPPAQMVREHLLASLGNAVDLSGGNTAANVLDGRILNFERVLSGKNSKAVAVAVVALELSLYAAGKPLLNKTYQAEQAAADDSLDAFVVAMEQALSRIYAEFLADLARSGSSREL